MRLFNYSGQRGFTLIEMIIVIAIIGVLTAIAIPAASSFIGNSQEKSYKADKQRIQTAVTGYLHGKDNPRLLGRAQFPLIGRNQTSSAFTVLTSTVDLIDQGDPFALGYDVDGDTVADTALINPAGGTTGADLSVVWADSNSDGVRSIGASSGDRWTTIAVTSGGKTFYTDPRYFAIDFEALVDLEMLDAIPESVSADNAPSGSSEAYAGSYIWYVDHKGRVRSILRIDPTVNGFVEGVYP